MNKLFWLLFLLPILSYSQAKFDEAKLTNPKKFGAEVSSTLNTIECYEVKKDSLKNCFYLQNGLRSSNYINGKGWMQLKDSVEVYRIDVVYSKYPLRKGVYEEIYPLLFKRLQNLMLLDIEFNDVDIQWNKVLQTHCENDDQVNSLFHGAMIYYKRTNEVEPKFISKTDSVKNTIKTEAPAQGSYQQTLNTINKIATSTLLNDSLKKELSKFPPDMQRKLIEKHLQEQIEKSPNINLKEVSKEKIAQYAQTVQEFIEDYASNAKDSSVMAVLNRHPEWQNMLVVNDWTGSMYGYGAQILKWHLLNFEKSGVKNICLFNDGNATPDRDKNPGDVGGVYFENADNIDKMVALFNLVMLKGNGGDGQENDVEAILKAIEKFPENTEIVLIADNGACVRDIELADRIGKPVKIVLCGYNKNIGVNEHFAYLAKVTGGGLYTLEDDITNLNVTLGQKGTIDSLQDSRFKIFNCNSFWGIYTEDEKEKNKVFTDLRDASKNKKNVHKLDLSNKGFEKVHPKVFKFKKLNYLDLSKNQLCELSVKIEKLSYLKVLNLSHNKLKSLPTELAQVKYIEVLNLEDNKLSALSNPIIDMKYLKHLDVSHNQITSIDKRFLIKTLLLLDLSNNNLSDLPSNIGKLKSLKILDVSYNSLNSFSSKLCRFTKLDELNLEGNNLTALPPQIASMKQLKILRLSNNNFSEAEKEKIRTWLPSTEIIF